MKADSMVGKPLIIAGPCSAETEDQLFGTAKALSGISIRKDPLKYGITLFRAGLWKPRTHPDTFEGIGAKGIPWLNRIQKELGLKVMTEVATAMHVEKVLEGGLDSIWIGSRTVTNPFAVQEIADSLRGTDIPVFVKNPVNPDIELWIGAFERLYSAGMKDVTAIHRGFSFYGKSKYRNQPEWQIPIELRRKLPGVKLLCDPSHIAGKREYVYEISQQAMDLGFDGLFVESHIFPDMALSDAEQQISPKELESLLSNLEIRGNEPLDHRCDAIINDLREKIDIIDDNIVNMISSRMEISDTIGRYKKENNMTLLQQDRWEDILSKVSDAARDKGLEERFVRELFSLIHQASIDRQRKS